MKESDLIASEEEIEENFRELRERLEECSREGEVVGYTYPLTRTGEIRHVGPEEKIGSANGIHYCRCGNCGAPYRKPWSSEDWEEHRELLKERINYRNV